MGFPLEFHGVHAAPLAAAHERIRWAVPVPRTDRIRGRSHTCVCQEVQFELCEAGGLAFIRRLRVLQGRVVVHETEWTVTARAVRLWELLLRGRAR
ncbi:hypothetical protein ACFOWE_14550 [Planomonospora corallina]|uniref:Uncharacterized protein n=1 Tax=Planomonospora corallina TaxID=1806052 RepID=A0ABV8I852_9ACTN